MHEVYQWLFGFRVWLRIKDREFFQGEKTEEIKRKFAYERTIPARGHVRRTEKMESFRELYD